MASTGSLPTTSHSPALRRLINEVRTIVARDAEARAVGRKVAEILRSYLQLADFLTPAQMEPCGDKYHQHILHVEADGSFSIVALVWLPGQATPIHDHVSWCVVGVYRGQEHETTYQLRNGKADPHLVAVGETINPIGSVAALVPPGDIHHVENAGTDVAVSLHIYGADIGVLGSSIRRRYDLEVRAPAAAHLP